MNIKANINYVFAAWGAFIINILQIFIFYYIWITIYGSHESMNGIPKSSIISYVILTRILFTQVTWGFTLMISHKISSGEIAIDLLRPFDFELFMYAGRLGDFVSFGLMNGLPALLVSTLCLGIYIPHNPLNIICLFISLLFAITISFFIEFCFALLTFYTNNGWGIQVLQEAMISLFSGVLVPIQFMPPVLKNIVELLPFKDMIYTPVSIYLELTTGSDLLITLLYQFMWVIALLILSRIIFNILIKKVTVQGG